MSSHFLLIHKEKTLTEGLLLILSSVTDGVLCLFMCVHVHVRASGSICVSVVTHKSIDRALAHWSVCLGFRVNTHASDSKYSPFLPLSFFPISVLPLLCPLSASFSRYLLSPPAPPPSLYADPDFGIQCCYGNNVGLVLFSSPSCSSYSG